MTARRERADAEAEKLLRLMSECNEGREIVSGSDGSVFVSRATAIQFALELAKRKVAEERDRCSKIAVDWIAGVIPSDERKP